MGRARLGMVGALVLGALLLTPAVRADHDLVGGSPLTPTTPVDGVDASGHLEEIIARSPAPEYRRYGSQGVAKTAHYLRDGLRAAGYRTLQVGTALPRWVIHHSPSLAPALEILDGPGRVGAVESGLARGYSATSPVDLSTGPAGITCTVVPIDDLTADNAPQSCALVPFEQGSPEWNNVTAPSQSGLIDTAADLGARGVIFQGDAERDMIYIAQVRRSIPVISAAVETDDIVGHEVRLRVNGAWDTEATMKNVVGVLPAPPGGGYVLLTAHIDSWFQGAVDNGAGTAATMDAAEALAARADELDVGVLVLFADAEEIGLLGSEVVADELAGRTDLVAGPGLTIGGTSVTMDDLVANVNLDAPSGKPSDVHGHDHENPVSQHGIPVFSWRALVFSDPYPAVDDPTPYGDSLLAGTTFARIFAEHGVFGLPVPSTPWKEVSGGWRTDAQHFHEHGVPVVWPVTGYPEYHTNLDVYDPSGAQYSTVDPVDLQNVADATVAWVLAR